MHVHVRACTAACPCTTRAPPSCVDGVLDGCQVRITPALEWAHAFTDCWRLHRDCFYDPNMHGLGRRGWRAVHDRQACQQQHMSMGMST